MSDDALRTAAEAVIEAWGAADQAYEMVGAIGALNDALASSRPEPLDVELSAAEAVLPKGWRISLAPYYPSGWEAEAHDITKVYKPGRGKNGTGTSGPYPTAVQAIRAIAREYDRLGDKG